MGISSIRIQGTRKVHSAPHTSEQNCDTEVTGIDNLLFSFLYTQSQANRTRHHLRLAQQPKRSDSAGPSNAMLMYRGGVGAGMTDLLRYFEVLEVLVLECCPGVDPLAWV